MTANPLLQQLVHGDRHTRDEAFDRLAESTDADLLEPLAGLATADNPTLEVLLCRFLQRQPYSRSESHLRRLLGSPNVATRRHACAALDRVEIEQRLGLLLELLGHEHTDVLCYALKEIGVHRRSAAIQPLAPLLESPDPEVASAAFEALRRIDQPRAARPLLALVSVGEPALQIAALEALGEMESFRRWRRLVPCLESPDAGVRRAAIAALSRRGGPRAHRHLIRRLQTETDEEAAKLIISRLGLAPDLKVATCLLPLAAGHANPQVRRSAGWVVEELEDPLLAAACRRLLPGAPEETAAYILTRMGSRELPDCGELIASCTGDDRPPRVLYAALEALGFLRDPRFLDRVVPFLESADPMAAYVATLAAAQMVSRLSDCPALTQLLRRPGDQAIALKQVVLQYMLDALSWDFDDPALFEILVQNLSHDNENIRYLSTILLGRGRGRDELVEPLLRHALGDANTEVRQVSAEGLDQVLDGELSPLLDYLRDPAAGGPLPADIMALLPRLRWGAASARRGLAMLQELDVTDAATRAGLARALFSSDPAACRACFLNAPAGSPWRLDLGCAWLESLAGLTRPEDRTDWLQLFAAGEEELVAATVAVAIDAGAKWTADTILSWAVGHPNHPAAASGRRAVRTLLEL